MAFKISGPQGEAGSPLPGEPGSEVLDEFLRRQVKQIEGRKEPGTGPEANGHLRQLQITPETFSGAAQFPALQAIRYLTLAPISGECRGISVDLEPRAPGEAGWLIVGTEKPIAAKEEIIVLAIAQKLSELARLSRMEGSIQLRTQFMSIASHELKTPLTSIYGILQLQDRMSKLKTQQAKGPEAEAQVPPEQKRSYLKILLRQVERLNELIDGLLDVSRMQSGRFMVEPSETDVAAVLRDTVSARLSVIASETGVKLHVESPESLVAWVDPVRWEEVITNLVMNAIRFSPEGGVVWIKLRDDGTSFTMTVRDQGPSVSPEDRERIFQPFERAQRTSRLGGLGLGLYISRQIALLHGGNVNLVESVPGKGNVFEAYFPIRNVSLISA